MAVQQVTAVEAEIEPDNTIAQAVGATSSVHEAIPLDIPPETSDIAMETEEEADAPVASGPQYLDLDLAADTTTGMHSVPIHAIVVRNVPNFTTMFKATHKDACISAAFTADGRYAATGSLDTSIKVLDVAKMKVAKEGDKPVVKTLYGHTSAVTDLAFHPNGRVLASVSTDCTVKLFDLTRASNKKAIHSLATQFPIHSIAFHPSGDYFALGTEDAVLRLYDIHTLQCFTNLQSDVDDARHYLSINHVHVAPTSGSLIATAGQDGDVRVWDMVSGSCIQTIKGAHDMWSVTSVQISLNEKYLLTCGRDNTGKLWEWQTGRLVHRFEGAVTRACPHLYSYVSVECAHEHDVQLQRGPRVRM
jgi:cleavage stimulation factor subunit 1